MSSNLPNCREECNHTGCSDGPFERRDDYTRHLRREHGPGAAAIHETLESSVCRDCGIAYQTRRNRCPGCEGGKGTITCGVEERGGSLHAV